ncbi:hypothetical protein RHMOL_Rhmol03G0156100 [Rhododendron molle]|uniref:Uncharacterized protein n=1 Tax=Rhododendron molle TaxID=49168 RepID=A0ACC0PGA4_RHOML|nr:hypothetical protein RHMOL_Rhmol03G0156100 [Rhododendron molle]
MAWCSVGDSGGVRNEGVMKVVASLALMVAALAVLYALVWAYERQRSLVEICLLLVRGLRRVDEVHVLS